VTIKKNLYLWKIQIRSVNILLTHKILVKSLMLMVLEISVQKNVVTRSRFEAKSPTSTLSI